VIPPKGSCFPRLLLTTRGPPRGIFFPEPLIPLEYPVILTFSLLCSLTPARALLLVSPSRAPPPFSNQEASGFKWRPLFSFVSSSRPPFLHFWRARIALSPVSRFTQSTKSYPFFPFLPHLAPPSRPRMQRIKSSTSCLKYLFPLEKAAN